MVSTDEADLSELKNWSVADEVHLLYSTLDNKPVGVDKHFQMSIIWTKFATNSSRNVISDNLWKKLNSWYNLKHLDESEAVPIDVEDEDFLLPSEVIPEYILRSITDEEKKYIDLSELNKKFMSFIETDDEDLDKSQFKLKGSDRMKWFELPQNYKSNDRTSKRSLDGKSKSELSDHSFSDSSETKKVILRTYGKAGEVSSGSILTLNISSSIFDESDENTAEVELPKEDVTDSKKNTSTDGKNDDKASKTKRRRSSKPENTTADSETNENITPAKRSSKVTEPITRSRKASSTSQDVSSGTESEKNVPVVSNDENARNLKRRFSQRVSSSESRPDTPTKVNEGSSKSDSKRKASSRR